MFKRILTLLWLMFLVFIFLPSLSTALTGGPDKGGYKYYDSSEPEAVKFNWDDIRKSRNSVEVKQFRDDSTLVLYGPVDIGFPFTFYGVKYSQVYISKYGYLTFNDGPEIAYCNIQPIGTKGGSADNFIAGIWANLHPGT